MPQATVAPVVLAAMIVIRLQTIVSRETPPGQTASEDFGDLPAAFGTQALVVAALA